MAIKKKSPLYEITDPTDPDYVDPDAPGTPGTPGYEPPVDKNLMKSDLFADEVFGADITKLGGGVQQVDTTGIDKRISQIETPTGTGVLEKQAAYYRQKGEGDVLRMQKDISSLFLPTIALYQEREAAASAKFEMLQQQIPEFDDTLIFGDGGKPPSPMPVVDEIKNISTSVKAGLKELSRLNVNDPRYDELRKKIEKEQAVITQFHEINQKLLAIRNDIGEDGQKLGNNLDGDWSDLMDDNEKAMWRDIYNSNGENIKVIDGKLMWVPKGKTSYDFGGSVTENDAWQDVVGGDKLSAEIIENKFHTTDALYYLDGFEDVGRENSKMYRDDPSKADVSNSQVKKYQLALEKLGFSVGGDGADGYWGKDTEAAYQSYLKDKDRLEGEMFDKYLSDSFKEKTQKVTPGKNIDLALIGDGPKMKNGIAFRTHLGSVNNLSVGLDAGARLNSKNEFERNKYKALRLSIEDDFKGMGVEGQASLLFDGTGRIGETDALAVDVFLNDIMANNEDAFPGYKSMNEEQRMDAWNGIRENGMLETYELNGKKASLQTHFKDFYMGEIDKKAMAYIPPKKKSTIKKTKNPQNPFPKGEYGVLNETHVMSLLQGFKNGEVGDYTFENGVWKDSDGTAFSGQQVIKTLSREAKYDFTQLSEFEQYNIDLEGNKGIMAANIKTYKSMYPPSDNKGTKYLVQIMVSDSLDHPKHRLLSKVKDLYRVHVKGDVYDYMVRGYNTSSLEKAKLQMQKMKETGFENAFIFKMVDGQRVAFDNK